MFSNWLNRKTIKNSILIDSLPPLTCITAPERGSMMRSFLSLQLVASRLPSVLKDMLRMTSVWQSIIFTGSPISRFQIRICHSRTTNGMKMAAPELIENTLDKKKKSLILHFINSFISILLNFFIFLHNSTSFDHFQKLYYIISQIFFDHQHFWASLFLCAPEEKKNFILACLFFWQLQVSLASPAVHWCSGFELAATL